MRISAAGRLWLRLLANTVLGATLVGMASGIGVTYGPSVLAGSDPGSLLILPLVVVGGGVLGAIVGLGSGTVGLFLAWLLRRVGWGLSAVGAAIGASVGAVPGALMIAYLVRSSFIPAGLAVCAIAGVLLGGYVAVRLRARRV